ncbi:MAG TPA: DUF370 domain-containing protein [Tepidimicrobium sp.]|nr:DUF370 domain-containing protein [Tepidimicrobium sp.]
MFIHIGNDEVVLTRDVIMILDKETTNSKDTSDFLQVAEEEGFVEKDTHDTNAQKKSLLVLDKKIFFSPISSTTLLKRSKFLKRLQD